MISDSCIFGFCDSHLYLAELLFPVGEAQRDIKIRWPKASTDFLCLIFPSCFSNLLGEKKKKIHVVFKNLDQIRKLDRKPN